MSTKRKVAIAGTGFGALHATAFLRTGRCELVGFFSRDLQRAGRAADAVGARAYDDFEQMLDRERPDVVSLAVPAPAQARYGKSTLERGIPTFFEKPLAGSLAAARELAELAEQARVATAINFELSALLVFQRAKELLQRGELGPLRHATVSWRVETYSNKMMLDGWKARSGEGGGCLDLFTSHVLHYAEWLLGKVASVQGRLLRAPGDARAGDSSNTLLLTTSENLFLTGFVSTNSFAGGGHRIDVFGDHGTLSLVNEGRDYGAGFELHLAARDRPDATVLLREAEDPRAQPGDDGRLAPTVRIAEGLLDAMDGRAATQPDIGAGLRVQQLMEEIRAQNAMW